MPSATNNDEYSSLTGFVYVFNLIVGTGSLTIPGAFSKAGWGFGFVLICMSALLSYITASFVIETLSNVNAIIHDKKERSVNIQSEDDFDDNEDRPLVSSVLDRENTVPSQHLFSITDKYQLGEMASILLSKPSKVVLYVSLIVYLYGDLSIYGAVVAKTLSHVSCTYRPQNISCNMTIPDDAICWQSLSLKRMDVHKIFLVVFLILLGPFVFFNVQKTKFLQLFTSIIRWVAFLIMILWSIVKLFNNGKQGNPPVANIYMLPAIFGSCVYSFMWHHSLPNLIHPIQDQINFKKFISADYLSISLFYIILSLTGSFAFSHVEDLYTLNFWPNDCNINSYSAVVYIDYFLALFPVFTLSASFPIIAITLRGNLKYIFLDENKTYGFFVDRILFPIITVIPPIVFALLVVNIQTLVGVIGSYAGAAVQYMIPCMLVAASREKSRHLSQVSYLSSPFHSKVWIFSIYCWMMICLVIITLNYINEFFII